MPLPHIVFLFLWFSLASSTVRQYIAFTEGITLDFEIISAAFNTSRRTTDTHTRTLTLEIYGLHVLHLTDSNCKLYPDLSATLATIQPFILNIGSILSVKVALSPTSLIQMRFSAPKPIELKSSMIVIALCGSLDHSDLPLVSNSHRPPRYLKFRIIAKVGHSILIEPSAIGQEDKPVDSTQFHIPSNSADTNSNNKLQQDDQNADASANNVVPSEMEREVECIVKGNHKFTITQENGSSQARLSFSPDMYQLTRAIRIVFGSRVLRVLKIGIIYNDEEYPSREDFIAILNELLLQEIVQDA